jgi:hypothetical protein
MVPGDFRFLTQRESYRSEVRSAYLAAFGVPDMWNRLANSHSAAAAEAILREVVHLDFAIGWMVGDDIRDIAIHGWNGYLAIQVAEHAARAAAGAFIPAPVPLAAPPAVPLPPVLAAAGVAPPPPLLPAVGVAPPPPVLLVPAPVPQVALPERLGAVWPEMPPNLPLAPEGVAPPPP